MAIYAFIMGFQPLLIEQAYFSYKPKTLARESLWIFINMFLAVVAAFVKKTLDEDEVLESLQKDNTLYRLKYLQSHTFCSIR